jgi:hypothetical protein
MGRTSGYYFVDDCTLDTLYPSAQSGIMSENEKEEKARRPTRLGMRRIETAAAGTVSADMNGFVSFGG